MTNEQRGMIVHALDGARLAIAALDRVLTLAERAAVPTWEQEELSATRTTVAEMMNTLDDIERGLP